MAILGWIILVVGAPFVSLVCWSIGTTIIETITKDKAKQEISDLMSTPSAILLMLFAGLIGGIYARAYALGSVWIVLAWIAGIYLAIGLIVGLGVSLFTVPVFGSKTVTQPVYKNPSIIVFWVLPLLLCGLWLLNQPRCLIKSGADLRECDLSGQDFDLKFADLKGINLSGLDLTGAKLTSADLSDADLSGANLTGAELQRADLTGADLSQSTLVNAKMYGAILVGAKLSHADLTGADLTEAIIAGASIEGINPDMLASANHGGSFLSEDAHGRLSAVCDGQGLAEAAAYDGGPGLHQMSIVKQSSDETPVAHFWSGRLPARWLSTSLETTELVVCVNISSRVVETCEYNDGSKLERIAEANEIVVREARTGETIAKATEVGRPANCPGQIRTSASGMTLREFGAVAEQTVGNWLSEYVNPSQ